MYYFFFKFYIYICYSFLFLNNNSFFLFLQLHSSQIVGFSSKIIFLRLFDFYFKLIRLWNWNSPEELEFFLIYCVNFDKFAVIEVLSAVRMAPQILHDVSRCVFESPSSRYRVTEYNCDLANDPSENKLPSSIYGLLGLAGAREHGNFREHESISFVNSVTKHLGDPLPFRDVDRDLSCLCDSHA